MSTETISTIIAIAFGPVSAIGISLWYQSRKQKIETKEKLFLTIMAHRRVGLPPSTELVNAFNQIDVVFDNCPKVVGRWREYFNLLQQDLKIYQKQRDDKYLELLYEMALSLGYKTIRQTDIGKFVSPRGIGEQHDKIAEIQQ